MFQGIMISLNLDYFHISLYDHLCLMFLYNFSMKGTAPNFMSLYNNFLRIKKTKKTKKNKLSLYMTRSFITKVNLSQNNSSRHSPTWLVRRASYETPLDQPVVKDNRLIMIYPSKLGKFLPEQNQGLVIKVEWGNAYWILNY